MDENRGDRTLWLAALLAAALVGGLVGYQIGNRADGDSGMGHPRRPSMRRSMRSTGDE